MPDQSLIIVVATFIAVAGFTGMLAAGVLRWYAPERRRLRAMAQSTAPPPELSHDTLMLRDEPGKLVERICRVMPRSEKRMGEMRLRLVNAGYRSPVAPAVYAASQIGCAILAGALALMVARLPLAIVCLIGGFVLPSLWLGRQVRRRARIIRSGLPDVVDLLIVCLESGCGLDQAIVKAGEELGLAYPPLQDELALLVSEIRAGIPRNDAFRHLSERTNVDDVRALVAMLVQTDRYGTSIAQALRVHADLLRTSRRQRAEERAAKANVKLVFPLVLCLFPAFYILTLGPAILQFVRVLAAAVGDN